MIARIIIKRKFMKDKAGDIVKLLNQMRTKAMQQNGYISGETLVNYAEPHDIAVLCTWQNIEDWLSWKNNPERKQYEAMLEVFQIGPTEYEEYMVGSTFQA